MSSQLPILIDASPGIDAAVAIYFALAHPALDVRGISTTFGNASVAQATRNALYLCALAGRHFPVATGVSSPMRKPELHPDTEQHGMDGLGNLPQRLPGVYEQDERSAARLIVDMAHAYPGELSLVSLGPLGNLVHALRLEPHLPQLLKQVIVTGGCITEPGNVSPVAESNMWQDPHAADIVLTTGFQLSLVGLDVSHQLALPLALFERVAAHHAQPATDMLLHAARHLSGYFDKLYPALSGRQACFAHALLGLLYFVNPELFKTQCGRARVVAEGLAEGQTILDRCEQIPYPQAGWGPELPKIDVALQLDAAAAATLVEATLLRDWLPAQPANTPLTTNTYMETRKM